MPGPCLTEWYQNELASLKAGLGIFTSSGAPGSKQSCHHCTGATPFLQQDHLSYTASSPKTAPVLLLDCAQNPSEFRFCHISPIKSGNIKNTCCAQPTWEPSLQITTCDRHVLSIMMHPIPHIHPLIYLLTAEGNARLWSNSPCHTHSHHLHPHKKQDRCTVYFHLTDEDICKKHRVFAHCFFMAHTTSNFNCLSSPQDHKDVICYIHWYTLGKHLASARYFSTNIFC